MAEEKKVKWTKSQLAAIKSIDKDTLVSASAGSGKTSLMMEKIARMVANEDIDGLKEAKDIKKMMIVTFTREVARELKIKVAGKLLKSIFTYPNKAERLREQIEDIAIASISTIDSLCSSIVRMYFQKAEVDPAFSVMEQEEADLYFSRAVTKVIHENDLISDEKYLALKSFLGNREFVDDIKKGYNAIRNHENYIQYLENGAISTYVDFKRSELYADFWKRLKETAKEIDSICDEQLAEVNQIQEDKHKNQLMGHFDELHNICGMIRKAKDIEDLMCFEFKIHATGAKKFKFEEDEPIYRSVASVYTKTATLLSEILCNANLQDKTTFEDDIKNDKEMLDEYVRILKEVDAEYVKSKQEDNKLDFNDIEQKTLLILSDEDIKKELQEKYDYICIDEYQDINPLQDAILSAISSGTNTFMVGDVKQSIYGFRLSDPTIFLGKYDAYTKGTKNGRAVDLNENFRSQGEILQFVNKVFDANMTKSFGGIDYIKDARLNYCDGKEPKGVERVKITIIPPREKVAHSNIPEDGIYSPKEHVFEDNQNNANEEALFIANKIQEIVGKVVIPSDKGPRPVEYKDIAILFRARSGAMPVVSELQRLGIPIDISNAIEDSKNFATSLLISLLNVIDNDQQDIELTNVLLSVLGGFNMAELAQIRNACKGGKLPFYTAFYTYEGPNKEISAKIDKFNKMIEKYRFYSKFTPVDKLLEIIIEDNMFDEYVLSQENGQSILTQLYTFLNALTSKSYNTSISKFLSIYREYGSIDSTKESSISTANCVKCNTVHGSKGLEYPIVFLINVDRGEKSETDKIIYDKKYGFGIKNYDEEKQTASKSFIYSYLVANSKNTNREEAMRGLYVALTRAQEYLYITAKTSKEMPKYNEAAKEPKNVGSYLGLLSYASATTKDFKDQYCEVWNAEEQASKINAKTKFDINEIEVDDKFLGEFNRLVVDDYKYEESTKTPIWHSVTQINKLPSQELEEDEYKVVYDLEDFFGVKEVTTPGAGTAYHRVLELLDFKSIYTMADLEDAIEQMVIDGLLTQEQREMVKAQNIMDCLNSSLMQIAKKNRCLREAAFKLFVPMNEIVDTTIEDKILVQGTFDLFIPRSETNKESILIDYKYSGASEKDIANTYNKQLKLYKKAIESCYLEPVDKMYIYVLGQNMQIEIVDKK